VAALISTSVADSRTTPQPDKVRERKVERNYGAFAASAIVLLGLVGYGALVQRQRRQG
jgi:hypothetical protein